MTSGASTPAPEAAVDQFITRWQAASGSERSNYQLFLTELVTLLDLPRPDPASNDTRDNAYVFERGVQFVHGDGSQSSGFIDLYRRGAFVLEAKKIRQLTSSFDDTMLRARSQAESYARALPADEGRPPFVLVVDVGHVIEIYSDFTRSGATYTPFPDPRSHRIRLDHLRDPALQDRLRKVWLDPLGLDPSKQSARVTRAIADRLARIAKALEAAGHDAERVAGFLTRCLFTFFAEDVELIPKRSFADVLDYLVTKPDEFVPNVQDIWRAMDEGRYSVALKATLPVFNGKLFKNPEVLPLTRDQIDLLRQASKADWKLVEPAIFGTLLEHALDERQRHALGAHFTPRAYVERLVIPTVIDPLREDWKNVQTAALTLAASGKKKDVDEALALLRAFQQKLCGIRVLDPACGSGNFLYVALEHLKRLEGEVLLQREQLGVSLSLESEGFTVDPHQFLGIEVNPRAAAIAELVLWIGYLQWHFRTRGQVLPSQPVLRDFKNIECRDAVLAWDHVEPVLDDAGEPVTRWDGRTMKTHQVTGEDVPDESARVPVVHYVNPRKAEWPEADFVVGNPPFIGTKRMKHALGDGYTEALRVTWPEVPESADFVAYWWEKAATLAGAGLVRRFGLITTNSLGQTFNRRVVERHLSSSSHPVTLAFAVGDHPWVDSVDGASVRIAMTVGESGTAPGRLATVVSEGTSNETDELLLSTRVGKIGPDLKIGASLSSASPLQSNSLIAGMGVALHGSGFIVDPERAAQLDQLGAGVIRGYLAGRDLLQVRRSRYVIDFTGKSEPAARHANAAAFQHVVDYVKPERDHNNRAVLKRLWWRFGWERPVLRGALAGLPRYIVTTETSKHRPFQFISADILADHSVVCIASANAEDLGVLSSRLHVTWALAAGGTLEDRPRYNKTRCFDPFPFPVLSAPDRARIADLAEELDAHRKRQQAAHPALTLTGMYNVLEKLKTGEPLTERERVIHEDGLVSVLKQLHDEVDLAVLEVYGWADLAWLMQIVNGNTPAVTSRDDAARDLDERLLERLVALNSERAAEEKRGLVRWLRPEFQNPAGATPATQATFEGDEDPDERPAAAPASRQPWPKDLTHQVRGIANILSSAGAPQTVDDVANRFSGRGKWRGRVPQILEMLAALGRARILDDGRYVAGDTRPSA